MDQKEIITRIRGLGFMAGVLARQGTEPLCSDCISYAITLGEARDALVEMGASVDDSGIPGEFESLYRSAHETIIRLREPENPQRQRKLGLCNFPDKACFVKKARLLFLFFKEKKAANT